MRNSLKSFSNYWRWWNFGFLYENFLSRSLNFFSRSFQFPSSDSSSSCRRFESLHPSQHHHHPIPLKIKFSNINKSLGFDRFSRAFWCCCFEFFCFVSFHSLFYDSLRFRWRVEIIFMIELCGKNMNICWISPANCSGIICNYLVRNM